MGLGVAEQSHRLPVMVLADLRPLRLGHDHAHEVVRLRVGRGDADRVAGVKFGFRQRASGEQRQGERLGRGQIVGIEPHDPRQKRLRRRGPALAAAQLVKQREAADVLWRALEKLDQQPLGFDGVVRRQRGAAAADLRRRPWLGPRRRPVEPAAAVETQAAAAGARRGQVDGSGRRHDRQAYRVRPVRHSAAPMGAKS